MGISTKEIDLFDVEEDLRLFEEDEWDFFAEPIEDLNSEFLCEVDDQGFMLRHMRIRVLLPYIIFVGIVCFVGMLFVTFVVNKPDAEYTSYMSALDSQSPNYIEGEEATSEEYIEISKVMQNYCDVLNMQKNYKDLDKYCSTTSTFRETYEGYKGQTKQVQDTYDNYARSMRCIMKGVRCNSVDKVIKKDGVYYAYVHLLQPTKNSVREYINLHKYNATKEFNGLAVTEAQLCTFLLDTIEANAITMEDDVICLEFVDNKGLKLVSDADILAISNTAYTYAVSQLTGMISAAVATKE